MLKAVVVLLIGGGLIFWGWRGLEEGVILGLARYSGYVNKAESPFLFYISVYGTIIPGLVCIIYAIKEFYRK